MFPLVWGHRKYHGLHALESVVINIHVLDGLAHARYHRSQILDVAHLLDLLDLIVEIHQGEIVLGKFLLEFPGLSLVKLLLGFLDEADHVSHTEYTVGDTCRMEDIQRLHLLSGGHELDRLAHDGLDGKGRTASGVTVHLGQHDAVEIQPVVESLGRLHSILTGHRIDHEQGLGRLNGLVQGGNFIHKFLIHSKTSGSIDYDHRIPLGLCLRNGSVRYAYGILLPLFGIYRHAYLLAQHLELVNRRRPEGVAGCEENLHAFLALEVERELAGESGLTRTVQTCHQDHSRIALDVDLAGRATHKCCKLIVDYLDHHLLRLDRSQDILSQCLGLHPVAEILRHLVADVRVKQSLADVLDGLRHVDFSYLSFSLEDLERPLKPFLQVLKHTQ